MMAQKAIKGSSSRALAYYVQGPGSISSTGGEKAREN
jgi:hypothetical protein